MPVKVRCHADFKRQIAAFRDTGLRIDTTTIRKLVGTAALSAQKLARVNLKESVYTAELPKSAKIMFPSDPEKYLTVRRLGHVHRSIKVIPPYKAGTTWASAVHIPSTPDFPNYYYALILNYGGKTIDYKATRFWTKMESVMIIRFRIMGKETMAQIKASVEGKAASEAGLAYDLEKEEA